MSHAKIVEVSDKDAYYEDRENLVGMTGLWFTRGTWHRYCSSVEGYEYGSFIADRDVITLDEGPKTEFTFFCCENGDTQCQ